LGTLFENRGRRGFDDGYITEVFTDRGIQFLERQRSRPFLLHMAYNSAHTLVHEVPEKYLKKFGARPIPRYDPKTMGKYVDYYDKYAVIGAISDVEMRKYYLANLNCLDDNIGRLLDALERLGLARNTLVILASDNGGTQHGGGCNRPLRGAKSSMFEGGIRVPFTMRWPARLPAGKTYPYRVSALDVLPTLLEAAAIPADRSPKLDGESFLRAVSSGSPSPAERRPLFWLFGKRWAVMDGDWKLAMTDGPGGPPAYQIIYEGDPAVPKPALFNLKEDPAERHDVSGRHPEVASRLNRMFDDWRAQMLAEATAAK
jgi:arylsulfatase A-like enzyme